MKSGVSLFLGFERKSIFIQSLEHILDFQSVVGIEKADADFVLEELPPFIAGYVSKCLAFMHRQCRERIKYEKVLILINLVRILLNPNEL